MRTKIIYVLTSKNTYEEARKAIRGYESPADAERDKAMIDKCGLVRGELRIDELEVVMAEEYGDLI